MRRTRRALALLLLLGAMLTQSGCANPQSCGPILNLLLGTAVSVGGYFLVKELTN